jgi:hypothetical protein
MTCQSALERLLDAEPGEFSDTGSSPLGEHLRGCARCRRVAAQLMEDTQRLALAMAAAPVPRRSPSVRQMVLVPTLAMAVLVVAVMWRVRPPASTAGPGVPGVVQTPPAPPVSTTPAPDVPVAKRRPSPAKPVTGRAFARSVPLAAVRLEPFATPPAQLSVETSGVTVTPSPGTRATVMHTSNPKLLVVWLY